MSHHKLELHPVSADADPDVAREIIAKYHRHNGKVLESDLPMLGRELLDAGWRNAGISYAN
ncbi:hypothetical protein [Bradyrhizobium sp. HKCCYLS3013]|uniref:hypothetical protein n=1 Tax=Bradyrhizobium sp. HKCCYLS3013 TaxID=3420735 RepID=UPI003EB95B49